MDSCLSEFPQEKSQGTLRHPTAHSTGCVTALQAWWGLVSSVPQCQAGPHIVPACLAEAPYLQDRVCTPADEAFVLFLTDAGVGRARSPAGADILICFTVARQPPLTFLCLSCHIPESSQPWPRSDSLLTPDNLLTSDCSVPFWLLQHLRADP